MKRVSFSLVPRAVGWTPGISGCFRILPRWAPLLHSLDVIFMHLAFGETKALRSNTLDTDLNATGDLIIIHN